MRLSVPWAAVLSSARAWLHGGVVPGVPQFLEAGHLFGAHLGVHLEEVL